MTKRNAPCTMAAEIDEQFFETPGAVRIVIDAEDRLPCGVNFCCPCGCGLVGAMNFIGRGRGGPEWTVIGEWPNVSMTPSIGFYGRNRDGTHHWHGFLTNGVFEEC